MCIFMININGISQYIQHNTQIHKTMYKTISLSLYIYIYIYIDK